MMLAVAMLKYTPSEGVQRRKRRAHFVQVEKSNVTTGVPMLFASSSCRHICVVFICLASRARCSQRIAVAQNWSPSVVSDGRSFLRDRVCLRPRSRIEARISPMSNSDRPRNSRARRIAIGHTAADARRNGSW